MRNLCSGIDKLKLCGVVNVDVDADYADLIHIHLIDNIFHLILLCSEMKHVFYIYLWLFMYGMKMQMKKMRIIFNYDN